jgi:hypothetical protein
MQWSGESMETEHGLLETLDSQSECCCTFLKVVSNNSLDEALTQKLSKFALMLRLKFCWAVGF